MASGPAAEAREVAAIVALLRTGSRSHASSADALEETGSPEGLLEQEQGLLTAQHLDEAIGDVLRWRDEGIRLVTLLDPDYPENLRGVHDRPLLLFLAGQLARSDARAVAVIGSRRASPPGLARARAIATTLTSSGYTVVSGLAAGIDAVTHRTALEQGGRTIAVIGTGLHHAYPAQNARLQRAIARQGAVLSQFWPEERPRPENFPLRNAVMSGISLATVVVEATHRSGARTQVRAALNHGRPILLARSLLEQPWARELANRPGVHAVGSSRELLDVLASVSATDQLLAD